MSILELIIVILVVAWLGGFALSIGGGLIHLLLVVALIVLIARLLGFNV
ncbi:MAG TPA: lmo0937 family membrane protein [Candidatus Saccharimonadales bacterium]|nr:lmo0937 family membrane protein [Candidatus Saccharimonadales bacterium]